MTSAEGSGNQGVAGRTCLFCGSVLGPATKEEHVIAEKLGGRLSSKQVTCSACNERASRTLDLPVVERYSPLLRALAPLLPTNVRPGMRPMVGLHSGRRERMLPDGTRELLIHEEHLPDGRVSRTTMAMNVATIENLSRLPGAERVSTLISYEPLLDPVPIQLLHPLLEVGLLRMLLMVFDDLATTEGTSAFARSADTSAPRQLVAGVLEGDLDEPPFIRGVCLGWQLDDGVRGFMMRILNSCFPAADGFSHLLVVWSDAPRRTLNAAWMVLGADVIAFELADRWRGGPVSLAVCRGVLKNSIPMARTFSVPGPSLPVSPAGSIPSESFAKAVGAALVEDLTAAIDRATVFVQIEHDESLLAALKKSHSELGELHPPDPYPRRAAVSSHLWTLYGQQADRSEIAAIVQGVHYVDCLDDGAWTAFTRLAYQAVRARFGEIEAVPRGLPEPMVGRYPTR